MKQELKTLVKFSSINLNGSTSYCLNKKRFISLKLTFTSVILILGLCSNVTFSVALSSAGYTYVVNLLSSVLSKLPFANVLINYLTLMSSITLVIDWPPRVELWP